MKKDVKKSVEGKKVCQIKRLIKLAESNETAIDQKINYYKEIAKYTYPKFKPQELRVVPTEHVRPIEIRLMEADGTSKML